MSSVHKLSQTNGPLRCGDGAKIKALRGWNFPENTHSGILMCVCMCVVILNVPWKIQILSFHNSRFTLDYCHLCTQSFQHVDVVNQTSKTGASRLLTNPLSILYVSKHCVIAPSWFHRLCVSRLAVLLLHPLHLWCGPPLRHPGVREGQGQRLALHAGPHPPHHHRDEFPGRPAGGDLRRPAPVLHVLLQRTLVALVHDAGELQLWAVRRHQA